MNDAQAQITQQPPGPIGAAMPALEAVKPSAAARKNGLARLLYKGLQPLASLRLTVVLFALSIILVFCGTLAQVDTGIWTVMATYFRSLYVWIPLQIFFLRSVTVGGGFYYPGGWLLGSILLVNLLAAHAIRFKFRWNRSGIILLHAGVIVIMLGELITGLFAVEGSMTIFEGQSNNFVFHPHETELAIMAVSKEPTSEVTVVPMKLLRSASAPIKNDSLPFDLDVVKYMVNSRMGELDGPKEFLSLTYAKFISQVPDGTKNLATAGLGAKSYIAVGEKELGGVVQDKEDHAAAYVRFLHKGTGQDLGTFLVATLFEGEPQFVTVDGKRYDVRLRYKRSYKDYSIHLLEFRNDYYLGTDVPKNYSSRIRLVEPARNVDREVLISMNNPLRYGGETFYQQSFQDIPSGRATVLQVVRNPAWLMPYISCIMVALGMLIHFGFHLVGFLGRRAVQ